MRFETAIDYLMLSIQFIYIPADSVSVGIV